MWETSIDMDEGSSVLEGNCEQDTSQQLPKSTHQPEGLSMVEEIFTKEEDCPKGDEGISKVEGCPLKMDVASPNGKMDVASPNGKMDVGSPKIDASSLKMEVASPKMEAASPNMEVSSPNMEVSSPTMDVSSPNMEEGSAKMEEVAVKMGEVSVKSEERINVKENCVVEQGSSKMEEVAVKMGEVSVKAEGNSSMNEDASAEKGSVKMEEVSVKMEKVSVQSEGSASGKEMTFKVEEESEKKVQFFRGTPCVTEGEVPEWLTVDILVRAIRNDKPGTKKPQIRPFGSPSNKARAVSHGHPGSKPLTHDYQIGGAFSSHVLNRSESLTSGEASGSQVAMPSNSQSVSRASTSQSVGKPSTSELSGKPSTSQSSNKLSNSQSANKPSSSCLPDRPLSASAESKSTSGQGKGKAGPGVRVKGKSSLSVNKGKAPVSEVNSRASGSSHEVKSSASGTVGSQSTSNPEGYSGGNTVSEDSSEFININKNIEEKISDEMQGTSSALDRHISKDGLDNKDIDDNTISKVLVQNSEEISVDCNEGNAAIMDSSMVDNPSASKTLDDLHASRNSGPFKKPTDRPKRSLKKPGVPLKGFTKKQVDPSKETFKKPTDPPKRTLKKPIDSSKDIRKLSETPKVRFKEPEVPAKDVVLKSSESSKIAFKNSEDSSGVAFKKPGEPPKRSLKTAATAPKKPKQPPLQVIRFISQRLSSGNTVYRVRATAVRGSVARDCHLVVKRCSNAAEVTYYKKVAPRIPYVPRVLLCEKNIVVMDDLVHEGFRRPRGGKFTPAQMTVAIDGLARMHTASVVALKRDPSLIEAFPQAAKATESDIARDLRLLADRVKMWSVPDADYYAARCRALAECVPYLLERLEPADTNMTVLLHGNVSPRNVFFLYDSRNPRLPAMASFVDFANVYWGHPALDISLVTGRAGGFWEGYKIVLLSLLTRASGRMWMPQPEIKDCGETYAFALLRAVCSSVSGSAAKVLEARLQELFPVFRQYSWLDFW